MRLGMRGFNPDAGIGRGDKAVSVNGGPGPGLGLGFVSAAGGGGGFNWGNLVGDLARGWTNIGAQILVPPTYVQGPHGVEIRGGAPVLATGPGAVGTAGAATGASLVTGGGQTAVGLSTNGLMLAGVGVLALVLLMQGRR